MIRFLLALMLSAAACRAAEPFRLMSPEMDRAMRKYLPPVDDPELQKILDDPHLLLYSEREIPPAYQIWNARGGDAPLGLHDPRFNISLALGGDDPIGNGNREFPWRLPPAPTASPISAPSASYGCPSMRRRAARGRWSGFRSGWPPAPTRRTLPRGLPGRFPGAPA